MYEIPVCVQVLFLDGRVAPMIVRLGLLLTVPTCTRTHACPIVALG